MNRKNILICALLLATLLLASRFTLAPAFGNGAPSQRTGSPGDGATCVQCHGGVATKISNSILNDIPTSGYVPGVTYNFTASISHATFNKFGFQVSPQKSNGQMVGTLVASNPSNSQIVFTKWITHTGTGTAGSGNAASWTFQWIAPAAGTGSFGVYGAYVTANGDGTSSGDAVFTTSISVNEDVNTGINNADNNLITWEAYPNPCNDFLEINLPLNNRSDVKIILSSLDGKTIIDKTYLHSESKIKLDVSEINSGAYFISFTQSGITRSKKFIKY